MLAGIARTARPQLQRLLLVCAAAAPAAAAAASGAAPGLWPAQRYSSSVGPEGSSHGYAASSNPHQEQSQHEHASASYAAPHQQESDGEGQHHARLQDDVEFAQQRQQLLAAALRHVPQLGWSGGGAAAAAAAELGLSPAAAGMLGSDAQLVQLFFRECNRQLEAELAERQGELAQLEVRERLRLGLQARLRMLEPCMQHWAQALSLLAQPAAAPRTLGLYAELADAVWHAAGDTTTNLSWYTKRAALVGVYSATELYMLTDCSPGYADTWAALDRQLDEALQLSKAAEEAGSLTGAVGSAAGALLAQFGSLLGRRPEPPV